MKVLLINDYLEKFGGAEIHLYDLKELLNQHGHNVKIYGSQREENLGSFFSRWFSLKHYLGVRRLIKEFRPEIIHSHGISRNISPSVILAAKNQKIPVVMTIHDFHYVCPKTWMIYKDGKPCRHGFGLRCLVSNCYANKRGYQYFPYHWLKWLKVWLHRRIIKNKVSVFICPSKILVAWIKKSFKVSNVVYLPNSTVLKDNKYKARKNDIQKMLLFVGRLNKEKGVDTLINGMGMVTKEFPKIKLKIFGDGPERETLQKLTKELNLQKNVEFFGKIPNNELSKHYQEAMVVVMPSIWMENNPIVVFEAMAYGKPIIASNIGGIPELIKDGYDGLLFEPGNSEDLVKKIIYLLKNPKLAKIMGKRMRESLIKYSSSEKHSQAIIRVYNAYKKREQETKSFSAGGNTRKIKILHLLPDLDIGGCEQAAQSLVTKLDKKRFFTMVCSLFRGGIFEEKLKSQGIKTINLSLKQPKNIMSALPKVISLIKKEGIDIIHSYTVWDNLIARLAAKITGIKSINGKRGLQDGFCRRNIEILNSTTLLSPDVIISNSKAGVEELLMQGMKKEKIIYIPNGINQRRFNVKIDRSRIREKFGLGKKDLVIGMVGRLASEKGINYLLESFSQAVKKSRYIKLIIIGSGYLRKELEELSSKLKIKQNVIFLGKQENEIMPVLLKTMDFLVLPSTREGMPRVIMEAMAAGLPVITTDVGGSKELVEDGKTGFLVPSKDQNALTKAIINMVKKGRRERNRMGDAGKTKIKEFSLEKMIKSYESVYKKLWRNKNFKNILPDFERA